MEFSHFLSAYYPDTSYGGDRLYADMISQARLVDRLGYRAVTIPEHHLINILLVPDPLQFAVKVASVTSRVELVTSVCVLPLHDMRVFAGRAIQADILCEGRLVRASDEVLSPTSSLAWAGPSRSRASASTSLSTC